MNTPPVDRPNTDPTPTDSRTRTYIDKDGTLEIGFLEPPRRPGAIGRLGHHEVLEVLGRGGFGIVLRAFDEVLERVVAIKVMAPEIAATSPARRRFLREARMAAQVRHENVVQIHAIEEHPLPYLVMEFIPGETLQQRLDRVGPFDPAEVVALGRQIAEGLAAAHVAGMIHRDIKPSNILIEAGARPKVKITDFGLARAADDASLTQSGAVVGTPLYMSPEQARAERLDPRSDLFSLGSVLYAITAGRPPFRAGNSLAILKRVAEDAPRPIPEVIPETPDWLCRVIGRLMAKNPDERFQSAAEVADALEAGRAGSAASPLRTKPRRVGTRVAVAVAAVVVASVGVVIWNNDRTGGQSETPGVGRAFSPVKGDSTPAAVAGGQPPVSEATTDRAVAEWVLKVGGRVRVNGELVDTTNVEYLPMDPLTLTWVDLNGTRVTDDGVRKLSGCRGLAFLSLENTAVTGSGLAHLRGCKALAYLDLHGIPVTDDGLVHLAALDQLRELGLYGTRVTGVGLAHLKNLKRFNRLHLFGVPLTSEGLAAVACCQELTYINLHGTPVTDAGLALLAGLTKLEEIGLYETQVTDAGLRHLRNLRSLKRLDVKRTAVTAKAAIAFHTDIPTCKVEHNGGILMPKN